MIRETVTYGKYRYRAGRSTRAKVDAINSVMEVSRDARHLFKGGKLFALNETIARDSDYNVLKITLKYGKRKADWKIYTVDRGYFLQHAKPFPITNKSGEKEDLLAIEVDKLTSAAQSDFFNQEELFEEKHGR